LRNRIIFILIIIISLVFSAETKSRIIGPGSNYYNYIDEKIPISMHILEFDLNNPHVEFISEKAQSKLIGREKTSVMAQQLELNGEIVIAAINADFFHKDGKPVGIQVADGEILKNPYIRSVFGLVEDNKPFIEMLKFQGKLFAGNNGCEIDGINSHRGENELILFNNYVGVSSNTNNWGYEISLQYLSEPVVNDTSYLVVIAKNESQGNKEIPGYGVILSGHGKKGLFLKNNIEVGDTIKTLLQLPPTKEKIVEAVSGAPKIVEKGRVKIDVKKEKLPFTFSTTKHPRTAIGYNRDKTRLLMFVIDGRQPEYSVGMSLRELAKFMIEWGVYEGLNLDGGGSSTMYVRGEIANKPSDSNGERPVSNALIVLCKDKSEEVKYLSMSPKRLRIQEGSNYSFDVNLFDEFFNPLNDKELNYFCEPNVGYFNGEGIFISGNKNNRGYVFVQSGGTKDSCWVIIE